MQEILFQDILDNNVYQVECWNGERLHGVARVIGEWPDGEVALQTDQGIIGIDPEAVRAVYSIS